MHGGGVAAMLLGLLAAGCSQFCLPPGPAFADCRVLLVRSPSLRVATGGRTDFDLLAAQAARDSSRHAWRDAAICIESDLAPGKLSWTRAAATDGYGNIHCPIPLWLWTQLAGRAFVVRCRIHDGSQPWSAECTLDGSAADDGLRAALGDTDVLLIDPAWSPAPAGGSTRP